MILIAFTQCISIPVWAVDDVPGFLRCLAPDPVETVVRVGSHPPRMMHLIGGAAPALQLRDPLNGQLLWSAGATAPALRLFPDMWAGFSGSLTVLDLDDDGTHDRIYAGDLAGRLWRFDIHHGADPSALISGGVFATLGGGRPAVRAFVAPPDVSLSLPSAAPGWLNVALGSASPGALPGRNRFYVLRDHAPFEIWSDADYQQLQPVREEDLEWMTGPSPDVARALDAEDSAGFYVDVAGSVLTASITVSGRAFIAVASDPDGQCSVATTVSSLLLQAPEPGSGDVNAPYGIASAGVPLHERISATTRFGFVQVAGSEELVCQLGMHAVDGCSLSTRLIQTWWRREDAD